MNERFRREYIDCQKELHFSDELKANIIKAAQSIDRGTDIEQWRTVRTSNQGQETVPRKVRTSRQKRNFWSGIAAVACLILCAVIGVSAFSSAVDTQKSITSARPFELVAFANEPSMELRASDEITVFQNTAYNSYNFEHGVYTSCLFEIKGEGIEYVDIEISKGALAAQVIETYIEGNISEIPEHYLQDTEWPGRELFYSYDDADQSALKKLGGIEDGANGGHGVGGDAFSVSNIVKHRSLGDSFSYSIGEIDEGTGIDFSQVKLSFKLEIDDLKPLMEEIPVDTVMEGYLAEIERVKSAEGTYLGYFDRDTGEPMSKEDIIARLQGYLETGFVEPPAYNYIGNEKSSLDLFDGETLAVTVYFDDGTQSRKTYLLKTGWLKTEKQETYGADGTVESSKNIILPELFVVQEEEQILDRYNCVYTLYAVELM